MEAMARHPGRALMWALWLVALLGLLLGGGARAGAQAVDDQGFWREPFLAPDPGVHTAMINRADVDVAERFVVTGSDDKSVRVWSVADGKLLRTIRVPAGPGNVGKVYAVALSPDGVTIAAAGWTGLGADKSIYFFDRATGEMAGRIGGLPNVVDHLAWSPDGTRLLATLGGPNGVRLYDASTRREVAADADYGDASYWGAFDHAGRIVTTSFDGQIRLYDASLARLAAVSAPGGKLPFGVAFSPDGASIAFGYHDPPRVDILDGLSLARLATPDTSGVDNGDLSKVAWSRDGTTLFAAGKWPMGSKLSCAPGHRPGAASPPTTWPATTRS